MNTAELTTLLNEDRAAKQTARLLANITRRAETLFANGYTMKAEASFYFVYGPEGQTYIVFTGIPKTGEYCSCPCFKQNETCKHYLAVKGAVQAEDAALDAQAEREDEARTFFAEAACAF